MYRFIASDMDGTILLNGAQWVDERTLCNVERLVDGGVIFAPASGRQYPNLKKRFNSMADRLAYISENGAFVVYQNEILLKRPMDRELGIAIMEKIYETPHCEVLVSGEQTSYLKPKAEEYLHRIRDLVKNNVVVVENFGDIKEDFLKISACDLSGIRNSKERLTEPFSGQVQMAVSGELYLDFTAMGVNKGNAVMAIQKEFGIKKEETACFGDNFNDLEMFAAAGVSYCMRGAAEEIKKKTDFVIDNVNDVFEMLIREVRI